MGHIQESRENDFWMCPKNHKNHKNGNWVTPDGEVVTEAWGNENGEYNRRKGKNDRRGAKQQNNTSSRNNDKNIRKLGKTNDVSKEKQGETNRRGNNRIYKEAYGNIIDKAKTRYGTTNDFKFGAYLLPDGSLLVYDTVNLVYRTPERPA